MNFLRQGFQKLSSDRQADTTKIIYHATSRVVKYLNNNKFLKVNYMKLVHCDIWYSEEGPGQVSHPIKGQRKLLYNLPSCRRLLEH